MPYIFGFMANYFIPVILWIPDTAFPRWNLLAVQIHTGAAFLNSLAALGLSPSSGWTMYPPMSTLDISTNTDLALYSLLLLSVSSTMNAIVTITTIMVYRPKDMDVIDLPMWMGGVLTSSWLILSVLPVLSTSFFPLLSDKHLQSSYFLDPRYGGDFLLYQHLFWFSGHPEVQLILFPSFGSTNDLHALSSRARNSDPVTWLTCTWAIALLGLIVYGHHMMVAGLSTDSRMFYSITSTMIAFPASHKVFALLQVCFFSTPC